MDDGKPKVTNWLWESLPYIYFAVGCFVIVVLQNGWAIFSGCAWIIAGVMALGVRAERRKAARGGGAGVANGSAVQLRGLDSGSLEVSWSDAYQSGNRDIDAQHRSLFDTGNALLDAINRGRAQTEVETLLGRLIEEVRAHFAFEENLLDKWGHPAAKGHKVVHQRLLAKAQEMRDRSRLGLLTLSDFIGFFVNDLLLQHIVKEDRKFFHQV